MSTMQMGGQNFDAEREAQESIKVEHNSRGTNYSYRIVKREGENWTDVLARVDRLEAELKRRFGGEA